MTMKRKTVVAVGLVMVAAFTAGWLFLRDTTVTVEWCPGWPETVRGVGEASETIRPGPDGAITESDVERATERARWKAYYYAQLRLAEQIRDLHLDARTTIREGRLADSALRASLDAAIHAAPEVPEECAVRRDGDVVTARVVVEVPRERIRTLRQALIEALTSGRIVIRRSAETRARRRPNTAPKPAPPTEGTSADAGGPMPGDAPDTEAPVRAAASLPTAPAVPRPAPEPEPTGAALVVPLEPAALLPIVTEVYDGGGRLLCGLDDLPESQRLTGLPTALEDESARIEALAGERPLRLEGTVDGHTIVLAHRLSPHEAESVQSALRQGRALLVLTEAGGGT